MGLDLARNDLTETMCDKVPQNTSKPGCWIVGLVAIVWLNTEGDSQCHCAAMSADVMSDHTGHMHAMGDGCQNISMYRQQTPKIIQIN